MSKYILRFPSEIGHMENNNQWLDVVTLLYRQWAKNPMDENKLVCLAMEAWYAILELEYKETECLVRNLLERDSANLQDIKTEQRKIYNILRETISFGIKIHCDGFLFNMYVGYAAMATPVHFVGLGGDWEKTGLAMIHKAYLNDDKDLLTKVFYYESLDHYSEEFRAASREFWTTISLSDWGDSAVQHHLFCILDGDKYHSID